MAAAKYKSAFKALGISLSTVLVISGLTFIPTSEASALEAIEAAPKEPSPVIESFEETEANKDSRILKVSLDKSVEGYDGVSLYEQNNPVAVDHATSGNSVDFTVPNDGRKYEVRSGEQIVTEYAASSVSGFPMTLEIYPTSITDSYFSVSTVVDTPYPYDWSGRVYLIDSRDGAVVYSAAQNTIGGNKPSFGHIPTIFRNADRNSVYYSVAGDNPATTPTNASQITGIIAQSAKIPYIAGEYKVGLIKENIGTYPNGAIKYKVTAATNRTILTSSYYTAYKVITATGEVTAQGPVQSSSGMEIPQDFKYYIAKKDASVTNLSQLQDIRAISTGELPDGTFPLPSLVEARTAGGSNPSDVACSLQCHGDPISTLTGEYFETSTDIAVDSPLPLEVSRAFNNSNAAVAGPFGLGSTMNYSMKIVGDQATIATSTVVGVKQENGSVSPFFHDGTDFIALNTGAKLTVVTGGYEFSRPDGLKFRFNSSGTLQKVIDRNGNEAVLTYVSGKISKVASAGKQLTFTWTGSSITGISNGLESVSYSYTSGRLTSVTSSSLGAPKIYTYDSSGRVKTVKHPNLGIYTNTYDTKGRVTKQVNPLGGETNFEYGSGFTVITHPDATKTKEEFTNNRLAKVTYALDTPSASVFTYTYDKLGQKLTEKGPGIDRKFTTDSRGNILTVSDFSQVVARFTYNEFNQIVQSTDAIGNVASRSYDTKGNLLSSTSPEGRTIKFAVKANGTPNTVQTPKQVALNSTVKTTSNYDVNGYGSGGIREDGSTYSQVNDAIGRPLSTTDSLNRQTSFEYDTRGQLQKTILPSGAFATVAYDNAGRINKTIDLLGNETSTAYDAMDNVLSTTTVDGVESYTYDNMQRLVSVTEPNGAVTTNEYDKLGRIVKVTDPLGNVTTRTYNSSNLLATEVTSIGTTTYGYDSRGNLTSVKDPANNTTSMIYDDLNRMTRKNLPNSSYESYSYDKDGLLLSKRLSGLETTSYQYDLNGNLLKTTYPDLSFEERTYDLRDRLLTFKNRDGSITTYGYDQESQVVQITRPDTTIVKYTYDSLGNELGTSFDGGTTLAEENEYNIKGQLLSASNASGEVVYSYDPAGRLTARGPPTGQGNSVKYSYDSNGELESLQYPSGLSLSYDYNLKGQLTAVESASEVFAEYQYDAVGRLTTTTAGNGVVQTNSYDARDALTSIGLSDSSGEFYKRELTYDGLGLIKTAKSTLQGVVKQNNTYTYKATNVLELSRDNLLAKNNNYNVSSSYNLLGSPWGTSNYTAAGKLQNSTIDSVATTYTHDNRGNRTLKTAGTGTSAKKTAYQWTPDNLLSKVTVDQGLSTQKIVNYTYDSDGLMASRAQGTTTEKFSWDTLSDVPTLLEDGSNLYVYGVDNAPLAQIKKSNNAITYLHGDERNSIVAATSETGTRLWGRTYDEYGKTFVKTDFTTNTFETPYAYAGERQDSTTGLYYNRARWYEPSTGSFISEDPAVAVTGEGYSYGSGNPLSYTDPLGLWSLNDTLSTAAGIIDGISPIPFAADLANSIAPGSVNPCGAAYRISQGVAMVGSMFVPGVGAS